MVMIKNATIGKWLLPILLLVLLTLPSGCAREVPVSFSADVKPILDQNCVHCHQAGGEGFTISGFDMTSYEDLMRGTQYGPMIIAGDSAGSNLLVLMEGRADPSINMPHGAAKPVRQADIETIRTWIDQGAKNN
jgi:hypothetical protein